MPLLFKLLISIALFFIVALLLRSFLCWYWKINARLSVQQSILDELKEIKNTLAKLNSTTTVTESAPSSTPVPTPISIEHPQEKIKENETTQKDKRQPEAVTVKATSQNNTSGDEPRDKYDKPIKIDDIDIS